MAYLTDSQLRHAYTLHIIEGTAKYLAANWLKRATPLPGLVEVA